MQDTGPASRRRLYALALLLMAVLTMAHIQVVLGSGDYSGLLLVLDHGFDVAAVLALLTVCVGVGRWILGRLEAAPDGPIDALAYSTAVGAGAIATLILLIGLLGVLSGLTLGLLFVTLGTMCRRELVLVPGLVADAVKSVGRASEERALLWFGIAAAAVAILITGLFALAPPFDWDALMYHLKIPADYLAAGRVYLPEDNLHVPHVGPIHMLYLPLLAIASDAGPAMLNVAMAALLALAMFSLCARFLGARTGALTLGLLWGTTTLLLVAMSPRVDVALTLFLFLAHYALLSEALEETTGPRRLFVAAALLGVAVGIKLSALPYVLALAPLIAWAAHKRSSGRASTTQLLFVFGAWFVAAAAPWLVKNWLLLGAPLYPFFAEPQLPPWLAPLFGGTAWPAAVDPQLTQFIWELRAPFSLGDAFFAPGNLTIELEGADYYLNPALLALPLWLLFVRNRTLNWLVIPALTYLFIVLVVLPSPNLRYLLPAIPPLTIAVAHVAVTISHRFLSLAAARAILISLTCLALVPTARALGWRVTRTEAVQHLVGVSSANDYLASRMGRAYVEVIRLANGELDEDSRILMLFDARGYYFRPAVIQDNMAINWPLLASVLPPDDCLESMGITHVLLGTGSLGYYAGVGGLDPERLGWSSLQAFAARCLEPLYEHPALMLFRSRQRTGASAVVETENANEEAGEDDLQPEDEGGG
jgi:hypothetical protein